MWEFRCLLICCIPLAFAVNNQVLHLRNGCHRTPPSLFIILYSDIWHVGWHPAIAAANDVYRTDVRRERERARAPTSENVNFLLLWTPFFFSRKSSIVLVKWDHGWTFNFDGVLFSSSKQKKIVRLCRGATLRSLPHLAIMLPLWGFSSFSISWLQLVWLRDLPSVVWPWIRAKARCVPTSYHGDTSWNCVSWYRRRIHPCPPHLSCSQA